MPTVDELNERIIDLEMIIARMERTLDDYNEELLRLDRLHCDLEKRFETAEARRAEEANIRALEDEPPPPHY